MKTKLSTVTTHTATWTDCLKKHFTSNNSSLKTPKRNKNALNHTSSKYFGKHLNLNFLVWPTTFLDIFKVKFKKKLLKMLQTENC